MKLRNATKYTLLIGHLLTCILHVPIQADVHRVPEGVNGIQAAVAATAPGDTVMLTSSGGHYREERRIAIRKNLTLMADPNTKEKPIWTTEDTRHIRAYADLVVQGVILDGQNTADFGIRSEAERPNTIRINDCIFENFVKDAITEINWPVALCDVRNSIFRNIGATAIEFRTEDTCKELQIQNCTFYNIHEQAIAIREVSFPITVRIQNVTIYGGTGGIHFNNISLGEVRNSIITNGRVYGIRSTKPAMLINNCVYSNWINFDGVDIGPDCFQQDPLFFKPENNDFSLLPDSPCIDRSGHTLGDLRWAGEATVRAGNLYWINIIISRVGIGIGIIGVGIGIVWLSRKQARQQERRKTEMALKESEAKYRDLFNAAHDIILIANEKGNILDINKRGESLTRYDHKTLQAFNIIDDLTTPEDQPIIKEALQKAVVGQDSVFEVQWLDKNKNQIYLEGAITPHITNKGHFASARCIFRDITERRQTERELIRLERLRSLGEMAAGVSHNLNNILSGILLPAEILKEQVSSPTAQKYIDAIHRSGQRATDLVSRLHVSVRGKDQDLQGVEINDIVQDAIKVTQPRWQDQAQVEGRTIHIDLQLNDVPTVSGTEAGLLEVITNLIRNAIDAMPQGGTITIRTELVDYRVGLSIKDTGIGMDEDTRSRVFEPFFTTKMDVGTGLGLSTVYGTVTRWGGYIDVISAPGKGTTFKIELPLWLQKTDKEPAQTTAISSNQRRRILIVDDEELIRTTLHQVLSVNHDVIACDNGTSAIAFMKSGHFDVGLIDFTLPEQRGDSITKALKAQDPNFVAILISGWHFEKNDPRIQVFDFYIKKPFTDTNDIHDVLSQALVLRDQRLA